jgi:hypothetical protein
MSSIATRRAFIEAATKLTKVRNPSLDDINAVTRPLAQLIAESIGTSCELVLRIKKDPAGK